MNVFKISIFTVLVLGGVSARAAKVDQKVMKAYYDACVIKGAEAKSKGLGPKNVDVADLCSCLEAAHEDSVAHMSAPLARAHMAAMLAIYKTHVGSPEEARAIAEFRSHHDAEIGAADGCDQK